MIITLTVYQRLMLRYHVLLGTENLEKEFNVHKALEKEYSTDKHLDIIDRLHKINHANKSYKDKKNKITDNDTYPCKIEEEKKNINPNIRAYRLVTTDLFVEKAIAFLEVEYRKYVRTGGIAYLACFASILYAAYISEAHAFSDLPIADRYYWPFAQQEYPWHDFVVRFTKSFTFYGFIVLFAVYCSRLGRAMMDQAERLKERRHSLRQGRLFIHLNDGVVNAEDLEKAFDWNVSKGNAFANIPTEAPRAPPPADSAGGRRS